MGVGADCVMSDIELTPKFTAALNEIADGSSHLFITGKAGTGKSTLLRYYSGHAERRPVVLAPTGIAALGVGGQTIHRFFGFRPDIDLQKIARSSLTAYQARLYRTLKQIIIDEISMVRADLLDCVDAFLRKYGPLSEWPFGGVRLIMFGDLYQLPPVVTRADRELIYSRYGAPYFFAAHALRGEELKVIELDKIFRQTDRAFISLLNGIRVNDIAASHLALLNARCRPLASQDDDRRRIVITTTNAQAKRINADYLSRLTEPECRFDATVDGEFGASDYPTDARLVIKRGAKIMMLNNDHNRRWVNGSMATVTDIDTDTGGGDDDDGDDGDEPRVRVYVRIEETQERAQVERHTWNSVRYTVSNGEYDAQEVGSFTQFPFRLAWAITVHKSQGKTFSKVHIDLGYRAFAAGQTYVALSRCRTLEDLSLQRAVTRDDVYVDQTLVDFFAEIGNRRADGVSTEDAAADGVGTTNAAAATKVANSSADTAAKIADDMATAAIAVVDMRQPDRKDAPQIAALLSQSVAVGVPVRIEYIHRNGHVGYRTVIAKRMSQKSYRSASYPALEAYCTETDRHCIFNTDNILDISMLTPSE